MHSLRLAGVFKGKAACIYYRSLAILPRLYKTEVCYRRGPILWRLAFRKRLTGTSIQLQDGTMNNGS